MAFALLSSGRRRAALPIALVFIGPAAWAQPASGPPASREPPPAVDSVAVSACARHVRQANPRSDPMNQFDAHVSLGGTIRLFGSEAESKAFWRCMLERGSPGESK